MTIEDLWKQVGFTPNSDQEKAIKHIKGPLYLTAGPGSGKTRVLLWRTLNLIVYHEVNPEEILLTNFYGKGCPSAKRRLAVLLGNGYQLQWCAVRFGQDVYRNIAQYL